MRFITAAPRPVYVDGPESIQRAVEHCMRTSLLGLDTETLGKKYTNMTDQVLYMGLSPDEETRYCVPRKHVHHFKEVTANRRNIKALHNVKFDAHRLANAGLTVGGPWFDTLTGDFLVDEDTRENKHKLDDCSMDYFGIPMAKYKDIVGKEDPRAIKPGHHIWERFLDYASLDPWVTRKLALYLMEKLRKIQIWPDDIEDDRTYLDHYWDIEEAQLKCLFDMERLGINVDKERLKEIETSLQAEMDEVAAKLNALVGRPINPRSTKQIGEYLFDDLGLTSIKKTKGGAPCVDEGVINYFAGKGVEACVYIVQYRKAGKLQGTYATGLAKRIHSDGHIHTSFSNTKTTGRLGSSEPNLQNIPRPDNDPHGIRGAFIPDNEDCVLIVVDYAQLEMRLLACAASERKMIDAINEGLDMHSYTASLMTEMEYLKFLEFLEGECGVDSQQWAKEMRQGAKNVGFGIVYGISKVGLAVQLTEKLGRPVSENEAQSYIDKYLEAYPGVMEYMQDMHAMARNKGYVQTIVGRRRRLSKITSRNWRERGHAENQAINAPIQGSAADIVKLSMVKCWSDAYLRETLGCTLRHQIHDELIFNCPLEHAEEAASIIQEYMENPFAEPLQVPLPAEPSIVDNWKAAK